MSASLRRVMHVLLVLTLNGDAIEFCLPAVAASGPKRVATTQEVRTSQIEHVLSKEAPLNELRELKRPLPAIQGGRASERLAIHLLSYFTKRCTTRRHRSERGRGVWRLYIHTNARFVFQK